MMWFFLALYFALWITISKSISKRILKNASPQVMLGAGILSVPFMILILLLTTGISQIDKIFWLGVAGSAFLNVFSGILYFTSIKHAPISLLAPMASFNPVFTTIFALFALQEIPTLSKMAGIIIIVIGSYLLNITKIKHSIIEPWKVLFFNKYILFYLLANLIVAITPILEKIAIVHTSPTSPILVAATGTTLVTIFLTPVILKTVKNPVGELKRNIGWFLLIAPFSALGLWTAFTAYSLANLGYVTAVFKLDVLFTIFLGWLFFKEGQIRERLLGGAVMLAGTTLLIA